MTLPQRPDLRGVSPEIAAYIVALEAELVALRGAKPRAAARSVSTEVDFDPNAPVENPTEPPTTFSLITATAGGIIKRTPRHLYERQRRGGMGVFDLDAPVGDPPAFLTIADINQSLIIVTSLGRVFPLSVNKLAESPVRGRGEALRAWMPLQPGERLALVMPDLGSGYLTMVTERGWVRRWRYNIFGRALQPGTILYDPREGGLPSVACWSAADADLLIVTAKGNAIRFAESQIPVRGCLGMRVDPDDAVVGVAAVREESGAFLLADDGKGTVRLMAGFSQNKAPGSGGKQAMKADRLVAGAAVGAQGDTDIFVISRLGKIIRFRAEDVPAKEGVVQGVACMALRADQTTALVACQA